MITVPTKSAIHWMEAHRRRARTRALLGRGETFAAHSRPRQDAVEDALALPGFEGALDAAYCDAARLRATYALH